MIKVHEIEKDIKKICKSSFNLQKFDPIEADSKIVKYLEKIKDDFHHIEYEVVENSVKLLLFTSQNDGFDLSFKMSTQPIQKV